MPAVALQQRRERPQRGKQVEAPVRPGGRFPFIAVEADEKRGTVIFLRQPRRHNADHALVPAFAGQHDGLRPAAGGEHRCGLAVDLRFDLLPLAIHAAKLRRQLDGALRVGRQEQLRRNVDLAHAPSGIDPGRKRIADGSGGDPPVADAALRHQGREADALRIFQTFQALGDHGAVLARQGHDVRHRAEAEEIAVFPQQRRRVAADGAGQLERHADARQL